jgi:hypothetical protein
MDIEQVEARVQAPFSDSPAPMGSQCGSRSMRSTSIPARRRQIASDMPLGPPPTTSALWTLLMVQFS